ncbi:MAG TPA: TonB-dependent receptor plug domain-containing protein [Gemmatimonadaceae bacterium]|nr:TonB-dependent receptor plug domain-containing protein [Gemmatimonadaceae bacterium]
MRYPHLLAPVMFVACVVSACAPPAYHSAAIPVDRDVISFAEIQTITSGTALDAIRKMRPSFLTSRGRVSFAGIQTPQPTVYVDGMRYGGIETLQQIPIDWIGEVRIFRPSNLGHTGLDNAGGILAITTRRR